MINVKEAILELQKVESKKSPLLLSAFKKKSDSSAGTPSFLNRRNMKITAKITSPVKSLNSS